MNSLSQIEHSILFIEKLFQAEPAPTNFDRMLELIKTASTFTMPGAIGQLLETGIKAIKVINTNKHKVKALKYVADMYELQQLSQIEMKRLENEREKSKSINLYIEKSFQTEIDKLTKTHLHRMSRLENDCLSIIEKIDSFATSQLKKVDRYYADIIRENESKCVLYRQTLNSMYENKVTPADMVWYASQRYISIIEQAFSQNKGDIASTQAIFDRMMEYIKVMGNPNTFISFQNFIEFKRVMEDI